MSHFTEIQTAIKDIDALHSACVEMSLAVIENAEARGYGGSGKHGDFVIKLNGPFDICANRQPDGSLVLSTDWWDGHVAKEVGENFGRLLQMYGIHKATREARKRGHLVQRKLLKGGAIKLCIGRV